MTVYLLLLELPDGRLRVSQGRDDAPIVAVEGNQYLLIEMGDRLIEEGCVVGYQLLKTAGEPVRKADGVL